LVGRQEGYVIREKTSAPKHPGTAVNVCWCGVVIRTFITQQ